MKSPLRNCIIFGENKYIILQLRNNYLFTCIGEHEALPYGVLYE